MDFKMYTDSALKNLVDEDDSYFVCERFKFF